MPEIRQLKWPQCYLSGQCDASFKNPYPQLPLNFELVSEQPAHWAIIDYSFYTHQNLHRIALFDEKKRDLDVFPVILPGFKGEMAVFAGDS
ncbi:hypothetical protein [Endozoicomonas sp. SCSIO W0465]|uniref:hypothetical protein n=1 Tax=Endozoicomonas sp. SCSIO W0465 TaxID=2918516 RepID=UPI00207612FA|nr:hypothetical protein [Endozoicomonas sp. SCSIO W0465]USE35357.1 hypothetical protein MJO57_25165 [Endozoicomonas sp. SCSIO W0465]